MEKRGVEINRIDTVHDSKSPPTPVSADHFRERTPTLISAQAGSPPTDLLAELTFPEKEVLMKALAQLSALKAEFRTTDDRGNFGRVNSVAIRSAWQILRNSPLAEFANSVEKMTAGYREQLITVFEPQSKYLDSLSQQLFAYALLLDQFQSCMSFAQMFFTESSSLDLLSISEPPSLPLSGPVSRRFREGGFTELEISPKIDSLTFPDKDELIDAILDIYSIVYNITSTRMATFLTREAELDEVYIKLTRNPGMQKALRACDTEVIASYENKGLSNLSAEEQEILGCMYLLPAYRSALQKYQDIKEEWEKPQYDDLRKV